MNAPPHAAFSAASVVAHPNIALIKYWGKREGAGNLPAVGSLSITLDTLRTRTTLTPDTELSADALQYGDGQQASAADVLRVQRFLARVRDMGGANGGPYCRVQTHNNFPTGAGLASSASGFAALALAACRVYQLSLAPEALSALAREGSGSAARSMYGGYVVMDRGQDPSGADATARPLLPAAAWPLRVVVAITRTEAKAIGSTEGMMRTQQTSPYWQAWLSHQEQDLQQAQAAIAARDFAALAEVSEHSCFKMHALALSARPKLLYWLPSTVAAIACVTALRHSGVPVFCTMDAGPQVKAICLPEAAATVERALQAVPGVLQVMNVGMGPGAHLAAAES